MTPATPSADLDPQTATPDRLEALAARIAAGDAGACAEWHDATTMADAVLIASRLDEDDRAALLRLLDAERAAELLDHLPAPQAVEAIGALHPEDAARIIEELPSDDQADLLGVLEDDHAAAILDRLDTEDAEDCRRLVAYDPRVAGGLMVTEYLAYPDDATVADVAADMAEHAEDYADYDIQYVYVTDARERLVGVLRLRDLVLGARRAPLRQLMIPDPMSVRDDAALDDLVARFDEHRFFGLPVVDHDRRLVGVLRRSALEEAVAEDSEGRYRRSQGIVGGEELRSMPLLLRSRRRLSWLSVNIVLNMIAASVIAAHQGTLEAVIALAVFLPIISDMSGCSGNQAVAVSMRELTLGVLRPREIFRVLRAEAAVGVLNGLALGVLLGFVAFLWKGNPYLGLVVGAALALNTLVAVCIGGSVPLILKSLKFDPALASGPILTTVTDMCGFFLALTFASVMLAYLV